MALARVDRVHVARPAGPVPVGPMPGPGHASNALACHLRRAAEDWLKEGLNGRAAKTVKKNDNVLAPILATIGAWRLRELTADDVH